MVQDLLNAKASGSAAANERSNLWSVFTSLLAFVLQVSSAAMFGLNKRLHQAVEARAHPCTKSVLICSHTVSRDEQSWQAIYVYSWGHVLPYAGANNPEREILIRAWITEESM